MNQLVKEMGLDNQSLLAQKYNVNTGKLNIRMKKQELQPDSNMNINNSRNKRQGVKTEERLDANYDPR